MWLPWQKSGSRRFNLREPLWLETFTYTVMVPTYQDTYTQKHYELEDHPYTVTTVMTFTSSRRTISSADSTRTVRSVVATGGVYKGQGRKSRLYCSF